MLCNYLFGTCGTGAPDALLKGAFGFMITPAIAVGVGPPDVPSFKRTTIVGVGPPITRVSIVRTGAVGIEKIPVGMTPTEKAILL